MPTARLPAMVGEGLRQEYALKPLGVERGFVITLDTENRNVEDLEGILLGRDNGNRGDAQFFLPLAPSTARNGRNPKKRPDDICEYVVRRYLERKSSLEELVIALYRGNISISRAQKMAKELWGDEADIALISRHAGAIKQRMLKWLRRRLSAAYPYVFLRTMLLPVGKGSEREWCRVFVAVGVSRAEICEVLAVRMVTASDTTAGESFVGDLRARGLKEIELFLGENESQLIAAVGQHFPGVPYQGDFEQMERKVRQGTPVSQMLEIADRLRTIREDDCPESAKAKLVSLRAAFRRSKNTEAERILAFALPYLFSFSRFPRTHWARLRENTLFVRVMRDCREWTRVGGVGLTSDDILLMAAARWRHASRVWACRKFLAFNA